LVPVNLFEVDVVVPGQRGEERQQLEVDVEEVAEAGRGVTLTGDVTLARILARAAVPLSTTTAISWRGLKDLSQ
jgi:hypothetical protein